MLPASTSDISTDKRGTYSILNVHNTCNRTAGFFPGAVGTNASHSIFNEYNVNIFRNEGGLEEIAKILDTLKPADRGGHYVVPCMEETRKEVFQVIEEWLGDDSEPNILWLSGSPGAGKSAIASSMVSVLTERGRFGASFFFRRGDVTLSDPTALWPTVAHDLSKRNLVFANAVAETLKRGKVDLKWPNIDLHFKFLIEEPLMKTYTDSAPPVIVIDALDECGADRSQAAQRDALVNTLIKWSRLSKTFKLIVTGRDDRVSELFRTACKRIILSTGDEVSSDTNEDIRMFFNKHFSELGGSLFPKWPGEKVLNDLTARAAGLFIWAETIMKLLKQGLPDEQLELILHGDFCKDNLNVLYQQILHGAFHGVKGRTLDVYKLVISAIVLAKIPFHPDDLPDFLGQPKPSVKFILDKLSPVLLIGSVDGRLRISHLSFTEFLCDPKRCPEAFLIDRGKESQKLAMACFERMKEKLKFNICDLETSYLFNHKVENISGRIAKNIPSPLSYSCRFWAAHLRDTTSVQDGYDKLLHEVLEFFEHRFLFWLEVMSFAKKVLAANAALLSVIPWVEESKMGLSDLVRDASRFILNFEIPISESVPQIYLSALPFSPSESLIVKQYQDKFPKTLFIASGRDKKWHAMVNLLRGHSDSIRSVTFSHDSKQVASGSDDMTIRIWDAETGQVTAGPFEGHTSTVNSVAFSHNGKQVVSGSDDKTIRIWDVEAGQVTARSFEGHTREVKSVAFSPDGTRVVSGSSDNTIRIWDVETGQVTAGPFVGHESWVRSVAFSSDGKRVVSGSSDNTVRVWDIETGQVSAGPFEGHTYFVNSVVFSHDGKRIASGSSDRTIRIWDIENGQEALGTFRGHDSGVLSVVFSHDGKHVISGSLDKTVRIWDVETGQVIAGPFEGHASGVHSVAFSHDGKWVVSGSADNTIRIWNVETDQVAKSPFEGHTWWITSVEFSHDGKRVVSGSGDKTIRIWDTETGSMAGGPFTGHTSYVDCVMFSPDDKQVVSGSNDLTVRVWDVETGRLIAGPFEGHTSRINSVAFSQDGRLVVSGSSDKTVRVWSVETGQIIASPFEGHTSLVRSVTFSPDSKRVLSSSSDKTIRIWDIATGQVAIGGFDGHTPTLDYTAFSHDGKFAVAGFPDNIIKTLDVETGKVTGTFEGSPSRVSSIAYSRNGKWVISGGSTDKGIRIWDVETCQVAIGPFEGHTSYVTAVAFSPDCKRVVSGAADDTIRIWDVEAGRKADRLCNGRGYNLDEKSGWAYATDPGCTERSALFWVPQAFRDGLCDNITLIFIGKRSIWLDFSQFVHGESWTQCYSHRYKPVVETSSSRSGYDLKRKDPPSPCSPREQDFQRNEGSAQQVRIKMRKNSNHL